MRISKILSLLLTGLMLLGSVSTVYAIDTHMDNSGSLSLKYLIDEKPAVGVEFSIYRVGNHTENFQFEWTEEYAEYHLTMDLENPQELAQTIASYVKRDSKGCIATQTTKENGSTIFTDLSSGLYLIIGQSTEFDSYRFYPIPALIFLPFTGADGFPNNDAEVTIKYETIKNNPPNEDNDNTVNRKVVKIWKDNDAVDRPESVVVQLLRNGKVYQEKTLTEKNGWRYLWTGLDDEYEWTIVEKDVPNGYESSTFRNGNSFIITNLKISTSDPIIPEPESPPTESPEQNQPEQELPTPSTENLPQTGQNWTPVVLMAEAGIVCLVLGAILRKRDHDVSDT